MYGFVEMQRKQAAKNAFPITKPFISEEEATYNDVTVVKCMIQEHDWPIVITEYHCQFVTSIISQPHII